MCSLKQSFVSRNMCAACNLTHVHKCNKLAGVMLIATVICELLATISQLHNLNPCATMVTVEPKHKLHTQLGKHYFLCKKWASCTPTLVGVRNDYFYHLFSYPPAVTILCNGVAVATAKVSNAFANDIAMSKLLVSKYDMHA